MPRCEARRRDRLDAGQDFPFMVDEVKAANSTLIIFGKDDCVAIFLGSRTAYRKVLEQEPGTYFLSKGWIDAGITLVDELKGMEKLYGKSRAKRLMGRMLQHYRRLP